MSNFSDLDEFENSEDFKTVSGKKTKQQIILLEFKEMILEMRKRKYSVENILTYINKKSKSDIEIKANHLKTFENNLKK